MKISDLILNKIIIFILINNSIRLNIRRQVTRTLMHRKSLKTFTYNVVDGFRLLLRTYLTC